MAIIVFFFFLTNYEIIMKSPSRLTQHCCSKKLYYFLLPKLIFNRLQAEWTRTNNPPSLQAGPTTGTEQPHSRSSPSRDISPASQLSRVHQPREARSVSAGFPNQQPLGRRFGGRNYLASALVIKPREKLNYHAVAEKASTGPAESSGARMALWSCPKLG